MKERLVSKLGMTHPGELFRRRYLERHNISVQDAATKLNIRRESLTRFLNGNAPVSKELASKLETLTHVSANFWISWQNDYDRQQIKQTRQQDVEA
ncbi:addiction module antidote protein, HigA family [Idiomarina sp. A28L]|uniref:HigA family addiction module antitoxin n=1 Tax=Idiomarina sp. A28L TaxID=1036674 RepID=UPI0002138A69|nr:HigA family addiction module antitoxin [Idiomarina sp. A28L]EGN76130.1 addiction module antidote protein, HigA family [Idiomarina sp. A28L]